jgi:hypothetical protein
VTILQDLTRGQQRRRLVGMRKKKVEHVVEVRRSGRERKPVSYVVEEDLAGRKERKKDWRWKDQRHEGESNHHRHKTQTLASESHSLLLR